jgi:hypothetical protein
MAYNTTWFLSNPDKANMPGVLYVVVLVNKRTFQRECIKIGITKGKTWKDAIVRSQGFTNYEIRIQKIINGTLQEVYNLEQALHAEFADDQHRPEHSFGGRTECFNIACLPKVLEFLNESSI